MKVRKLGGFVSFVRFGHSTESAQHAIALSRVMHPQERERERGDALVVLALCLIEHGLWVFGDLCQLH
jgi:hypothetical protein